MPLLVAILIALFLPAAASAAEAYPSHAIRMVVPFPPAGIADLSARIVGDGLRARLGQTIVIENKPGANGIVVLREMLKAEPDGYTLKETGVEMVHVPYKGGPGALNDLLAGSIDVIIEVFPVVMEQIRSGAIKGLAVKTHERRAYFDSRSSRCLRAVSCAHLLSSKIESAASDALKSDFARSITPIFS